MKREMALMKRVAHEHVCKYYEHHISQDGLLFGIMMELLESGSLAQRIKESTDGRIREFEVIQIAFDILAGLAPMHDKGVIHRYGTPSRASSPPVYVNLDLTVSVRLQ